MTTNLVAAVTISLLTNILSTDNAKWGRDWGQWYPEGGGPSRIVEPATERYTTTNVVEHTEVRVELLDGPHTFTVDRTISSVTTIMKKQEQWKAAGVMTNSVDNRGLSLNTTDFGPWTNWVSTVPLIVTNNLWVK